MEQVRQLSENVSQLNQSFSDLKEEVDKLMDAEQRTNLEGQLENIMRTLEVLDGAIKEIGARPPIRSVN